jgi:hypothetical protein
MCLLRQHGNVWDQEQPDFGRMSVLIIDSLSFLVTPVLGSAEVDGHALMICLGRLIKQLAQTFSLVVLTTNHLVGGVSCMPLLRFH